MAKEKNNWQEIKTIVFSAIILGFVFGAGYNTGTNTFDKSLWMKNFIEQIFTSLIFLIIFVKITKTYSSIRGVSTTFKLWKTRRYGLGRGAYFKKISMTWGTILPIFIALLTKGKLFFSAIISPEFSLIKTRRLGKKYERPTEQEMSLITLIGPLTLTLLGILLSSIKDTDVNNLSLIPFSIAFCTMLPFPKLNGITVYFGTPVKYVFTMAFIIVSYYLTKFISPFQSLVYALIFTAIFASTYYIRSFIISKD